MPNITDAHALSSLAFRVIEVVLPKKERKHNDEAFILEMKHSMVPPVNVLNTISNLYALENVHYSYQCIDFFSFSVPSLFHVVVPVSLLSFTGKSIILVPEYKVLQTKPNRTVFHLANM